MANKEEILKHFDNIFGTDTINHINLNMNLLKTILDYLCELPTEPSEEYKKLLHKQIEISDKFIKTLNDEQMNLFNKYMEARNATASSTNTQLFCFGYIFAKELEREGNICKE